MKPCLVVVPCGRRKIWEKEPNRGPTPAQLAYTGPAFRVNRRYAERFADRWLILSAKYGFLDPDFFIPGTYNVTFKDASTDPISTEDLRHQVWAKGLGDWRCVVALGSKLYRSKVEGAFAGTDAQVMAPFVGLRIGEYMQAVNRAVEAGVWRVSE